ncbi:MAG: T9SS type A sorting domain-containing protein, partial [Psychroflexus salarius]
GLFTKAQTTAIVDQNFEQALIDLNIDSDATINGQVLTADIENLVVLDFSSLNAIDFQYLTPITDFTGIEDFVSLEVINLSGNRFINIDDENADFLNQNLNLREIYMYDIDGGEVHIEFSQLDVSQLELLEYVDIRGNGERQLIIDNPNFNYSGITIDIRANNLLRPSAENSLNSNSITNHTCIKVNHPEDANNQNTPYDTWTIIDNEFTSYSFSSNCNLSQTNIEMPNDISIYPNPVEGVLKFSNPHQIEINHVEVFDINGKSVITFDDPNQKINLSNLKSGLYFININYILHLKFLKQ